MDKPIQRLHETVQRLHVNHRFILGIDGLSRAGKTTLVQELRATLLEFHESVFVFHLDDHIVERKRRYFTGHDEWYEYYFLQWDVEHLRENLFAKLRLFVEITLPFYDPEIDEHFTKTVSIPKECVIIIEGVFLQRPEWQGFLDYCVYLDCPRDVRFAREGIDVQSKIAKFQHRYWKGEDYYLESVFPLEQADTIVRS